MIPPTTSEEPGAFARRTTSPITEPDTEIAALLEDVSVPVLAAAVAHLTQDPSSMRGPIRPRTFIPNDFQGGLDDAEKRAVREHALDAIRAYRDAGCPPVPPPDPALIRETMSWLVCEDVADDYAEMFVEETNVLGDDPRRLDLDGIDSAARARLSVVVVGCGQSGLLAGIRLKHLNNDTYLRLSTRA